MTGGRNSPGGKRATRPKRLTTEAAKDRLVELVSEGQTLVAALENIGYARKTYEYWRRQDESFKARIDQARQLRGKRNEPERGERLDFEAWRLKYLGVRTPWHQLQWVDLLEGREPRDLHPSQQFEPGKRNRILINCPPFHPLAVDTPIFTTEGWKTVGEVERGAEVFDSMGRRTKVIQTWESAEEDLYEVEFSTGDVVTVDGRHQWYVETPTGKSFERSTLDLAGDLRYAAGQAKWRVPAAEPVRGHDDPLPLAPYVLGLWLGDGATGKPEIAVGEEDLTHLLAELDAAGLTYTARPQRGGHSVYVKGIRGTLASLGVLDHKHIPALYATANVETRTALLQGLMDSDGTVTAKDGRCSFSQNMDLRPDLVRDVYRLVASLGFLPRLRDESRWGVSPSTGEKYWNAQHRIYFKPNGGPVFRLPRKAAKQKVTEKSRTTSRRIVDIRPAGRGPVKCLTVLAPGSLYCVGDGHIVNRNGKTVAITIDYVTYRLCMDPAFRVLLISAGSELAKDFLFGVKQRLTSPEFLELQKAYAPDGGWEATAESWTESKIVFGTDVRAQSAKDFAEKDANALALGMRSKVYGRRADLVIVDDGVDSTNVSEHAKQMKWLRGMVESRIEAGGKLLVIGTRVAPVDLYSELLNPANYANQRVPWTYLASPAILEEGAQPSEHKTLWPYAEVPWVQPEDATMDECLCEDTIRCSQGLEVDGRKVYARWDGLHLENGPRASNNNTEWALIFQQKSVAEDATFPEHAVSACTNGKRPIGLLKQNTVGHPFKGMHGMYVIAGLDPSIKGFAGIIVYAVDRETKMRYVLQAVNMKAPTKKQLEDKMKDITVEYGVHEWRVEKTGLLQFFTQDAALRMWFSSRGVRFTEHTTGSNKWDAGFGVSSLASLFGEYDKAWDDPNGAWREITPPLIELPRPNLDGMKALIHQLITWTPDLDPNKVPCDMVMALWFAEVGAREHLGVGRGSGTVSLLGRTNRYTSPRAVKNRTTVSLADFRSGS